VVNEFIFTVNVIGRDGHVVRMGRRVKKIFETKSEGSRRKGRPRLRWLEDLREDLREMKFKRWRHKTVDREEGASLIKEGKTVRGPYSKGVSKNNFVFYTVHCNIIIQHLPTKCTCSKLIF
jgi:PAS domain-containing protein